MERTLVVIRHAKSDWGVPAGDRERPLAARGRRQAPHVGLWNAAHLDPLDVAIVSPATRARQTWELAAAELPTPPPVRVEPDAYAFDGEALLEIVARLPTDATTAALVGHNPAVEELVEDLAGQWVRMPTAALAVVRLREWNDGRGRLLAAGRPADGPLELDRGAPA